MHSRWTAIISRAGSSYFKTSSCSTIVGFGDLAARIGGGGVYAIFLLIRDFPNKNTFFWSFDLVTLLAPVNRAACHVSAAVTPRASDRAAFLFPGALTHLYVYAHHDELIECPGKGNYNT